MDILGIASRMDIFGAKSDDDFSDRLNYRYTTAILLIFAVIIQTRSFGSDVIRCWVPAHFTSNYEQYVTQICWISNTYYYDLNQSIPRSEIERSKNEIKYYQWVSFVLLVQAMLFYFPRILWRTGSVKAGLNIGDLVDAAQSYKAADKYEQRHSFMSYMVKNIDQYVDDDRRYENKRTKNIILKTIQTTVPGLGRFMGNYIVLFYFAIKFVYICNTVLQIAIISGLLSNNYIHFGLDFIVRLWRGEGWAVANSKYFPKVTLCDFLIREVGNPNKSHKYTVQCVLPINLFNQQIFTVIWFWYVFVLIWNVTELIKWSIRSVPAKSYKWVSRRVSLINKSAKIGKKRLDHFLKIYLESDGIFMIRMIANNTSDYVAFDLIKNLWCQHADLYDYKFPDEPHNYPDIPCEFKHKTKQSSTCASSEGGGSGGGGGGGGGDKADSTTALVPESNKNHSNYSTVNRMKLNHEDLVPPNYLDFSKIFNENAKFPGQKNNRLLNIKNTSELVHMLSNANADYQRGTNRGQQMYYDNTDDPSASLTTNAIRNNNNNNNGNYNSRLINSGSGDGDDVNDDLNNPFPRRRDVNQVNNGSANVVNNSTNV